jgi:protein-S-isoprenylcysteine O-methyltransferase Ste14
MRSLSNIVIICWVIFWLYWFIAAFSAKKNTKLNIRQFAGVRFGIIVLIIILFRVLNVQNYSFERHVAANNKLLSIAGLIIFFAGLILAIWARRHLGRNWGTPMSQKQDPELVTSGPYKYIRHPIYSGILLAMLGTAIVSTLFWLIIFAVTGLYFVYSAVEEEKLMVKQFPKVYPAYKSKTKMLIPFIF